MISSSRLGASLRSSRSVLGFVVLALAGGGSVLACSSSDSPANNPPVTTVYDAGNSDDATTTSTNEDASSDVDSSTGEDDSSTTSINPTDASTVTDTSTRPCPLVDGRYATTLGVGDGGSESSYCPGGESEVCTYVTDPDTCKVTAACDDGGSFSGTLDSSGTLTYTKTYSYDAGSLLGTLSLTGDCTQKWSTDLTTFTLTCSINTPLGNAVSCGGTGDLTD